MPGGVWNIQVNDGNAPLLKRLATEFCATVAGCLDQPWSNHRRPRHILRQEEKDAQYVPIIAGADVHRYQVAEPSEYVLFTRPKTAGGCWDPDVHFAPHKLVVRQICEEPTASILKRPLAVTGNIFTVRAESVETELYLLGIVNSRLTSFFWRTMFADFKLSFPQVTIFSLGQVPIRTLDVSDATEKRKRDELVAKVEQMLAAEEALADAWTSKDKNYYEQKCDGLDRQIDRLVYGLYGLTDAEIATVEEATE